MFFFKPFLNIHICFCRAFVCLYVSLGGLSQFLFQLRQPGAFFVLFLGGNKKKNKSEMKQKIILISRINNLGGTEVKQQTGGERVYFLVSEADICGFQRSAQLCLAGFSSRQPNLSQARLCPTEFRVPAFHAYYHFLSRSSPPPSIES